MGTIVINQTDCKQNIVLQSSLDGITGGYYDAAGVWHELGNGIYDYYDASAFLSIGGIVDVTTYNYFDTRDGSKTRVSCPYFIVVSPGEYMLEAESSETVEFAINTYPVSSLDNLLKHTNTSHSTLGWQALDDKTFTLDSDVAAIRIAFRYPDNSVFTANPITKCLLKKVAL